MANPLAPSTMTSGPACSEFLVSRTWVMHARNCLVIEGSIQSGVVKIGMELCLPLNRSTITTLQIDSVEFVDRIQSQISAVALVSQFETLDEAELLQAIFDSAVGEVLAVQQGAESDLDDAQLTIVHTNRGMLLTKVHFGSWREVQAEFDDYVTSLGPYSLRALVDYLEIEYPTNPPFDEASIVAFAADSNQEMWSSKT
jgi:hypothetical protein